MRPLLAVAALLFACLAIAAETPQPPRNPAAKGAQAPERKPGMAKAVEARQTAPALNPNQPDPAAYNTRLGSVYALEQALAYMQKAGSPKDLIAATEATLAKARADLAATPKPPDPFQK